MCGRYVIYQTKELAKRFKVPDEELDQLLEDLRANYNVAPSQTLPVITQDETRHMKLMRWGLIPVWAKDEKIGFKMINARSETLFEKSTWKRPALKQRCLVPANGFYEWKKLDDGKRPFYIKPKDQELFSFAGVYDNWTSRETGEVVQSYSIVTTKPNKEMTAIHDRMPVILQPEQEAHWLDPSNDDPDSIADLLHPYEDNMLEMYEVSRDVGSVKNNSKELIYPISAQ